MIKFLTKRTPITFNCRYTFLPPSCYNIEAKPNPVISVTLGNSKAAVCDLHFRVHAQLFSCSKMSYPELLKTLKGYF